MSGIRKLQIVSVFIGLSSLFLSFAGLSRLVFPWHDPRLGLLLFPVLFTGLGLTRFGDSSRWLSFYHNIRRNSG